MIVVKPISVNDSILTSTVPEPDLYKNEVEWTAKTGLLDISSYPIPSNLIASTDNYTYTRDYSSNPVVMYRSDANMVRDGFTFSITSVSGVFQDVTGFWGSLFALDDNGDIYEFSESGVQVGQKISTGKGSLNSVLGVSSAYFYIYEFSNAGKIWIISRATGAVISNQQLFEDIQIGGIAYDGEAYYVTDVKTGNAPKIFVYSDFTSPSLYSFYYGNELAFAKSLCVFRDLIYVIASGSGIDKVYLYAKNGDSDKKSVIGDLKVVSSAHSEFQSVIATTDDPVGGSLKVPPTWVRTLPTNKYAMFDYTISTQTVSTSPIVVDIAQSQAVNAVAGFNIDGAATINVTVNAAGFGEVYNRDVEMTDNSAVNDAWSYYFEPIIRRDRFILLDLPSYFNSTITVTFTGGSDISVGALVMGPQTNLGIANYGTEIQLLDFSKQERNVFGEFEIIKRSTADLVKFDVTIPRAKVGYVRNQFKALAQVPAVWVGEGGDDNDPTSVFGYYENYVNNISSPSVTDATITIQGLV